MGRKRRKRKSQEYSLDNKETLERCKKDKEFLEKVMLENEDLIWFTVHKYIGNPDSLTNNCIDKDDILQVGRIGLLKSIFAFDPDRGTKFSSFAVTAILREIRTYLKDNSKTIKLTGNANNLMNKINYYTGRFGSISTGELSKLLNESEEKISKLLQVKNVKSLDEVIYDNITYKDFIQSNSFEEEILDKIHVDYILEFLKKKLTKLEFSIVKLKLMELSNAVIAKKLKISAMKVGRVLKKAGKLIKKFYTHAALE